MNRGDGTIKRSQNINLLNKKKGIQQLKKGVVFRGIGKLGGDQLLRLGFEGLVQERKKEW